MFKRVMVAVVGLPLLILILGWAPSWATMLLLAAMCAIGAWELMRAAAGERGKPLTPLTVIAAAAVPVCVYGEMSIEPAIGMLQVFLPLAISFGSDTFALFAGMLCGKHKLAPKVSPKKTVEGAIGGLLGGVIGMTVFKLVADSMAHTLTVYPPIEMAAGPQISWGAVFALGIIGSTISQIGDLSFSVIKREFGVKDYGNLLPGHGGILDRFDSVTFVAPFVWLALQLL